VDHQVLQPGDDWPRALQQALANSACVAALIPPVGAVGFFQRDEVLFALDAARATPARLRLVPVYVAGALPGDDTPYGLRALQHLVASALDDLDAVADRLATLAVHGVVDIDPDSDQAETAPEGAASRHVAPGIRARMAALGRDVAHLTEEQFRAIQQLRWLRRVRISGCAGSGKTLVAAEKAVRLAQAGQRVLFLCHNPLLADHVRSLLAGSGAHALAFGAWVEALASGAEGASGAADHHSANTAAADTWSHPLEPDDTALAEALRRLEQAQGAFDAVIVDEAQDFPRLLVAPCSNRAAGAS
jgi:hypothetical protein